MWLRFRRAVQWEDTFYFLWLVFLAPLANRTLSDAFGGLKPWDAALTSNVPFVAFSLIASVGCLIVLTTRAPGQTDPDRDLGRVENYARLPLLISLGLFLSFGLNSLGGDIGIGAICGLFGFYLITSLIWNRLPVLSFDIRRLLVAPIIVLGAWNFTTLSDLIFSGFDVRTLLNSSPLPQNLPDLRGVLGFELLLLFAGVLVYYLAFMFAPRAVAGNSGSWRDWGIRFAIYLVGVILGLGALQLF